MKVNTLVSFYTHIPLNIDFLEKKIIAYDRTAECNERTEISIARSGSSVYFIINDISPIDKLLLHVKVDSHAVTEAIDKNSVLSGRPGRNKSQVMPICKNQFR